MGVDEVIAKVGTTGSSTGCHLHFETILNGSHTNPLDWNFLPTRQVDQLDDIQMVSYSPASASADWAVPVTENQAGAVTGGVQEATPAAVAASPAASLTPTPTSALAGATPSPTATPTVTTTPTPTVTPTPTRRLRRP